MTPGALPRLPSHETDVGRVADAFRNDPGSRRALDGVWKKQKRYRYYPMEKFTGHVLRYLGEDPRSWRDWTDTVCAGANVVLREEGEILRRAS